MKRSEFNPDWVSPPGDTIALLASQKGLNRTSASSRLGLSKSQYDNLIAGNMPINADLAEALSSLVGPSRDFWLSRYAKYLESLRVAAVRLQREVSFPLNDMRRFGWIASGYSEEVDAAVAAANFMGVRSLCEFEEVFGNLEEALAFRRSSTFASEIGAVSAWYRASEIRSKQISPEHWSVDAFKASLDEARAYSLIRDPGIFVPKLEALFAACGVALCVLPAPSGCPVSGIANISNGRAIIALSARHLTDDHFWFSLFHEAGHLLLHGGKISIDVEGVVTESDEHAANMFAADLLVPPDRREELRMLPKSKFSVARFARSVGVSPGVVVGQLQFERRVRFNQMNYLKVRYKWRSSSLEMA